jgi:hypothetical protein
VQAKADELAAAIANHENTMKTMQAGSQKKKKNCERKKPCMASN